MSTLKVNTIQNTSGGSSSTPEQIEQGRAKVWIKMKGTGTISIRDSFNVTSIVDNDTGEFTVNFSITFASRNYCPVVSSYNTNQGDGSWTSQYSDGTAFDSATTDITTSKSKFVTYNSSGQRQDNQDVNIAIFGDV